MDEMIVLFKRKENITMCDYFGEPCKTPGKCKECLSVPAVSEEKMEEINDLLWDCYTDNGKGFDYYKNRMNEILSAIRI